nr:cupin domain-containing protein [Haliscomenobacter sp.]
MVKVSFDTGGIGALHHHHHTQISYVAQGVFEISIGGTKKTLRQGDGYYIPPNEIHGARCLEAGELVDVFTPIREDFIVFCLHFASPGRPAVFAAPRPPPPWFAQKAPPARPRGRGGETVGVPFNYFFENHKHGIFIPRLRVISKCSAHFTAGTRFPPGKSVAIRHGCIVEGLTRFAH